MFASVLDKVNWRGQSCWGGTLGARYGKACDIQLIAKPNPDCYVSLSESAWGWILHEQPSLTSIAAWRNIWGEP